MAVVIIISLVVVPELLGNSQVTRIENPGGALAVGLQVLTRFDFNLLQLRAVSWRAANRAGAKRTFAF